MSDTTPSPQDAADDILGELYRDHAELRDAYEKWVAKEDASVNFAKLLGYVNMYHALLRVMHDTSVLDTFMAALKEYWAVHHMQLLVDGGFFEAMAKHQFSTITSHEDSIPLDGRLIMIRSKKFNCRNPTDLLHEKAAVRGSADTVAAYIYRGGLNPCQTIKKKLALDVATSPQTKVVLQEAMHKIRNKTHCALGIVFLKKHLPTPLMRECLKYNDLAEFWGIPTT